MKILLSAYACEPNKGSEPGVGWGWLRSLAGSHHVHLITRENNCRPVAEELAHEPTLEANVSIEGHEVGSWTLWLKRKGVLPVSVYYLMWQASLAWRMRERLEEFDLVHHVTFNGFRTPGAWWSSRVPVVLGPLGGSAVAPEQFLDSFHKRRFSEALRTLSIRYWKLNPWTIASLSKAAKVLVVTRELQKELEGLGLHPELQLECAISRELEEADVGSGFLERTGFVWAGTIEPWKGWVLALEAYAQAFGSSEPGPLLRIFGDGRDREMLENRVEELEIGHLVRLEGKCSQSELWKAMRSSKGLLFSSIRETSGNVVLEAMGNECPVICINHQGAAIMTSDDAAFRVGLGTHEDVVRGLAEGLVRLESDTGLVNSMGEAGRRRVLEKFSWNAKLKAIEKIYSEVGKK